MSVSTQTVGRTDFDDGRLYDGAWEAGADADSLEEAVDRGRDRAALRAAQLQAKLQERGAKGGVAGVSLNLVGGALVLLVTLVVVLLAALVGGEFAAAIPSDSTFSDAITTTTDNAGTAFVIFGVTLLAIPATAAVSYIVMNMGPIVSGSNLGGRRMR